MLHLIAAYASMILMLLGRLDDLDFIEFTPIAYRRGEIYR